MKPANLVAKDFRLQEWAAMIKECNARPKGVTVTQWCENNNVTKSLYYYRVKVVREAFLRENPQIIPLQSQTSSATSVPDIIQIPFTPQKAHDFGLKIEIGKMSICVMEETSLSLLEKVLGVIANAE